MIDSGLVNVLNYDVFSDAKYMAIDFTSKASANQRKGRVGRTTKGYCYRIYSKDRYDSMNEHLQPEIQRIPLTELCLRTKSVSRESSIEEFIQATIEPPPAGNIHAGIANLMQIGALDSHEQITRFGQIALKFSMDVRLVKALIFSIILRCYEPVMRIVAMLSVKPPFHIGLNAESRKNISKKKVLFASGAEESDYHFLYNVYTSIYDLNANVYKKYDYCKENCLSYAVVHEAKETVEAIKRHFKEFNFLHTETKFAYGAANANCSCWELINACFVTAYFPNTSFIDTKNDQYYIESFGMEKMVPHSSSILSRKPNASILDKSLENWVVYKEKTISENNPIVRFNAGAIVSPMTMLIFAGRKFEHEESGTSGTSGTAIDIDGLIKYRSNSIMVYLLSRVRSWIHEQFEKIILYPETYGMVHEEGRKLQPLNEILKIERLNN